MTLFPNLLLLAKANGAVDTLSRYIYQNIEKKVIYETKNIEILQYLKFFLVSIFVFLIKNFFFYKIQILYISVIP